MENKLFIALDIDGVLNSNQDYSKFSAINGSIPDIANTLEDEIKFSKMNDGRVCYGNFVNRRQLKMLNAFIEKMIQRGYDTHIVGISSWFSTNPNDILLLNTSKEELYSYFEFNPEVTFYCANYTIGLSHLRLESFVGYCESILSKSAKGSDIIALYLDDLRHDNIDLFDEKLSNFRKNYPDIKWFYPNITERFGLKEEDLNIEL
jgi:hypothetical protein